MSARSRAGSFADLRRAVSLAISLCLLAGCGALPCADIETTPEFAAVLRSKEAIDERLLVAMRAGVAEARRRGADVPADDELPTSARQPGGELDPLVEKYAQDGDGKLRGEGADMSSLKAFLEQNQGYLQEKQDEMALERCILHYRS